MSNICFPGMYVGQAELFLIQIYSQICNNFSGLLTSSPYFVCTVHIVNCHLPIRWETSSVLLSSREKSIVLYLQQSWAKLL
jgi:hypothetical protein